MQWIGTASFLTDATVQTVRSGGIESLFFVLEICDVSRILSIMGHMSTRLGGLRVMSPFTLWQKRILRGMLSNGGGSSSGEFATIVQTNLIAQHPIIHFPTGPRVSGRANEWSARAKRAVQSKQMGEWCD